MVSCKTFRRSMQINNKVINKYPLKIAEQKHMNKFGCYKIFNKSPGYEQISELYFAQHEVSEIVTFM